MNKLIVTLIAVMGLSVSGCVTSPTYREAQTERENILARSEAIMQSVYSTKPDVRAQVSAATGYATFDSASLVFGLGGGGGQGVVVDNANGRKVYMNMAEIQGGLGIGAKKSRMLFVFHSRHALSQFINKGWVAGVEASATATAAGKGGSAGGELSAGGYSVYQLNEAGISLNATLKGMKFWVSPRLN